jgi:hypothetical protein
MKTDSKVSTGWVVALTSVASLMVALALLVVSTALSMIRRDLATSVELLQWTVTRFGRPAAAVPDAFWRGE